MTGHAFAVAALAYGSTNLDDFLLLTGLVVSQPGRPLVLLAAHLLATATLAGAALLVSPLASALPGAVLLGLAFAPLALGVGKLVTQRRRPAGPAPSRVKGGEGAVSILCAFVACGGDNLAVYIPVFARQPRADGALLFACFCGFSLIAFVVAIAAARIVPARPNPPATPFSSWLLIGLGGWSVLSALAR